MCVCVCVCVCVLICVYYVIIEICKYYIGFKKL